MATPAELLVDLENAIQSRLTGDAYEAYTEQGKQFKGTSLKDLFAIRAELLAETRGNNFLLATWGE